MTQIKKMVSGILTARPDDAPGVSFTLPNGEVVGVTLADLPGDIVTRLAIHGLSQKVGDSYAGASEAESPLAYATEAIRETIAQLVRGEWRITATGGGPRATLLARALARVTGKPIEECMGVLENLADAGDEGKAQLKAIRAMDAIKAASAAIKLEDQEAAKAKLVAQAAKGGSADDLANLFG